MKEYKIDISVLAVLKVLHAADLQTTLIVFHHAHARSVDDKARITFRSQSFVSRDYDSLPEKKNFFSVH